MIHLCSMQASIKTKATMVRFPSTSSDKIKILVGHWALPKVKRFFSPSQNPRGLPKSGPVAELLKAAQSLLDTDYRDTLSSMLLKGDLRFVGVLGAILSWLQQKLYHSTPSSSDLKSLPWYRIASNLSSVLAIYMETAIACPQWCSAIVLCYRQLDGIKGEAADTAPRTFENIQSIAYVRITCHATFRTLVCLTMQQRLDSAVAFWLHAPMYHISL